MATAMVEGLAFSNSARPVAEAYLRRRQLAELGYTVPQSEESPFLIDCFLILDSEIKRLQAAKLERDRANGR